MSGSTITNSLTVGITLGTVTSGGAYASPLTITSTGAVEASSGDAISGALAAPTIVNQGTIAGTSGVGVYFSAGGSVDNTGVIEGYRGVLILGSAGTVTNFGMIIGTPRFAVDIRAGGTVVNSGTITASLYGIRLADGGYVNNAGGLITAGYGIYVQIAAGTIANSGTIIGTAGFGIRLFAGGSVNNTGGLIRSGGPTIYIRAGAGTVANSGTIVSSLSGGVVLAAGGSVGNNAGLIKGASGIYIGNAAGMVTNAGAVIGTTGYGVALGAGGTVIDSGTISGGGGTAISFGGTGANLLVLDPGYHLDGVVVGGTSAGATNTLELGSAGGAGTVSAALDTEFVNFSTVTVDAGAHWTLSGNNTLGAGVTLTDLGTLTNTGTLTGAGTFVVDPASLFNSGSIGLTVTLSGGGYLDNEATGAIAVAGNAVVGTLAAAAIVNAGTIGGTGTPGLGVDLLAGGSVSNINAGLIAGSDGIDIKGAAGTVANSATIIGTGGFGRGVYFQQGGRIDNTGTGLIQGYSGVFITGSAGSVGNSATIDAGSGGVAVFFAQGGSVDNAGGLITGGYGADIGGTTGVVSNTSTIDGSKIGIALFAGGGVSNSSTSGLIEGRTGILASGAAGTIANSGTIVGTGTAFHARGGIDLYSGGSVSNGASALIEGYPGVYIDGAAGTVTNSGTIEGTGTGSVDRGVYFKQGGSVGNTGGLIRGWGGVYVKGGAGAVANSASIVGAGGVGVYISGGAGTVTNSGTIDGLGAEGVNLKQGGSVGNSGGLIQGYIGVLIAGGVGTLTNSGIITSSGTSSIDRGVDLYMGGSVTNGVGGAANGYISGAAAGVQIAGAAGTVINSGTIAGTGTGGSGIVLAAGGTVVDSGTISGASGTAISFGGASNNLLVVENGYKLVGDIVLSGSATNTVALAGSLGAAVTAGAGLVLPAANFQDLLFGVGGYDTAQVKTPSGSASYTWPVMVSGFTLTSDIVDLTSLAGGTIGGGGTVNGSDQLVVSNGTDSVTLQLDASDGTVFTASSDGASGTDITPVCFCRGTLILTDQGEVAVERLAVGDRVKTLSGAFKPVRWIGFGRDLVTRKNSLARPIVVRQGALADNVPRRDLCLTHGHALYLEGVLIPVEHLVNHHSILWDDTARVVEYYHIELEDHDVVFAEGAPAESYYDAGNRALFQNMREGSAAGAARPVFAPVLTSGETVERVWATLFQRVGGRTDTDTTSDPDLHLVIAGGRVAPASVVDGVYSFALTAPPAGPLFLRSRSAVPSLIGLNRHEHRRLGVAIRQIVLHRAGIMTCFDHDAPPFREGGCHRPDVGHSWTDGEFHLPASLFAHLKGAFTLIVQTSKQTMRYPIAATGRPPSCRPGNSRRRRG